MHLVHAIAILNVLIKSVLASNVLSILAAYKMTENKQMNYYKIKHFKLYFLF